MKTPEAMSELSSMISYETLLMVNPAKILSSFKIQQCYNLDMKE